MGEGAGNPRKFDLVKFTRVGNFDFLNVSRVGNLTQLPSWKVERDLGKSDKWSAQEGGGGGEGKQLPKH